MKSVCVSVCVPSAAPIVLSQDRGYEQKLILIVTIYGFERDMLYAVDGIL